MTVAPDVTRIHDPAARFALEIPERAPSGATVTIEQDDRAGHRRVHAQTPDGSEVYVEVLASAARVDHASAAAEQMAFLRERALDATISEPSPGTCAGRPALTFDFAGELDGARRVRRFAFVDAGGRTYRIVHDPGGPANETILRTLTLPADA